MPNKSDIGTDPGKLTQDKLRQELRSLRPLTPEELKSLFPTPADQNEVTDLRTIAIPEEMKNL